MMISTVGNHQGLPGLRKLAAASLLPPPPLPPYRVLCWPYRPAQKQGAVPPSKQVTLSLVFPSCLSNTCELTLLRAATVLILLGKDYASALKKSFLNPPLLECLPNLNLSAHPEPFPRHQAKLYPTLQSRFRVIQRKKSVAALLQPFNISTAFAVSGQILLSTETSSSTIHHLAFVRR